MVGMSKPIILTSKQVIDRILSLLAAMPDVAKTMPQGCQTKAFWQELFGRNARTRRLMETFQELPAFTEQAPTKAARWREVFDKDYPGTLAVKLPEAMLTLQAVIKAAEAPKPKRIAMKRWRDGYDATQEIQRVRPVESDEYIHNPHRGTTTFQRFQGDPTYAAWATSDTHGPLEVDLSAPATDNVKYIAQTTLSYCRWPWAYLEPKKGKYNWKIVDQALAVAHARGQTLQTRFQPYTTRVNYDVTPCTAKRHPPEKSVNVPDWYWDTGGKWVEVGTYAPHEPDSNDPLYLKHFGEFIRAFAKRYDGHPDLESVDMAYAGFWGESGGNSTAQTACKLTDIYLASFKKTQLLSMLGTPGSKHAQTRTGHTARPVGWRADCFGDLKTWVAPGVPAGLNWNHTFDAYPMEIQKVGAKDAWMRAPVTMETCGNVATWFMSDLDLDVIMREGFRYHMSVFMPKSAFFPQKFLAKLSEFEKKIGYRFALRQMRLPLQSAPGKKVNVQFFIDNVGCAPIYRQYALALRFRQGKLSKIVRFKQDIRTWLPGHTWFEENILMPAGFKKGEVKLDLAILDEANKPKVWLAIKGEKVDGWHAMTSMDVV